MAVETDVDLTPLGPFGVEVDIDLNDPDYADILRQLFRKYGLLLFRNQNVSMDDHRRVMGYLGPVSEHRTNFGYVSNKRDDGLLGDLEVSFHSDNSYTSDPLLAISLHAVQVPYETTSTRYVSGEIALASLPGELRQRVENLEVLNVLAATDEALRGQMLGEAFADDCPRYQHPLVISDPVSGQQALYALQMHTAAIAGQGREESAALLAELYTYLYTDANMYVHRWRNGDFVIWSNFRIQHARGALDPKHERTLQRVCISNGAPEVYEKAFEKAMYKSGMPKTSM